MGLLSFLFGGGKKDKPKAAAKAAPAKAPVKAVETPKASATVTVLPTAAKKARAAVGLVPLKLSYAAKLRAGDAAGAYVAACELARFYKKARVSALAAEYRAAADERFAEMLAAGGRRARMAAKSPRAGKLLGKAQAGLIAAHRDFAAKYDGKRAA